MEKFIPYEKLSKKKQRELNAARRGTWTINPVTRKPANPKAYNRKMARKWKDDSNSVPFYGLVDYVQYNFIYSSSKYGSILLMTRAR